MKELWIATRDLEGSVTVLDLDGALDKRTTQDLERAVSALTDKGRQRLVVNCERLSYISSDGIGVFLSHLIKVRKSGGDIKFCNMRDEPRMQVNILGLSKLLTIKETEREAVSDFKKVEPAKEAARENDKLVIKLDERGSVTLLALQGFVDRHTIELVDKALRDLLNRNRSQLVIDCAQLSYISSNGMGVFISYVNKARNQGGDIRFCCMRDIPKTLMSMLGLNRLFEVFEDRDGAVASFAAKIAEKKLAGAPPTKLSGPIDLTHDDGLRAALAALGALQPPARPDAIERAEKELRFHFPETYRRALLIANGAGDSHDGGALLGLGTGDPDAHAGVLDVWRFYQREGEGLPGPGRDWVGTTLIPFATLPDGDLFVFHRDRPGVFEFFHDEGLGDLADRNFDSWLRREVID
jgi:anti-sigma B factor antagonist